MSDEVAIKVDGVSKDFILPHKKRGTLKSFFLNPFSRYKNEKQHALSDISFEIKKGEFFGIVGRNGSGKSTLLKCLAGVYFSDKGDIIINGSLVPFIELGVGFNPELSGRDNVFLNGALLGFTRKEIERMYEEIVEFAELEDFMDQKLKNYSSGMQVRLAFSVAIQAKSDILILDEVLAVGDSAFQQKCTDYFNSIKKSKKTVILVTHDMNSVKQFCDRAMLLEKGVQKSIGSAEEIASQYTLDNIDSPLQEAGGKGKKNAGLSDKVDYLSIEPKTALSLDRTKDLVFDVSYKTTDKTPVYLGISVLYKGVAIIEHTTIDTKVTDKPKTKHSFRYELPLGRFNSGKFQITAAVFEKDSGKLLGFTTEKSACNFVVNNPDPQKGGLLEQRGTWSEL